MVNRRVGVILPAFNEAPVLDEVLKSIPDKLVHHGEILTIVPVVVDDGSTDSTGAVVLSSKRSPILISHIINSGAGAATRTGIAYLRKQGFEFGATMDSDGQHSPEDLMKVLVASIKGEGDIIIGSRLADTTGMPLTKRVGNKGLNFLTRMLLGVSSTDSQSGLKAFNASTILSLNYKENGYAFCSEMLWRAKKANLSVVDIPIKAIYTDYSKAKGQSNWNAFQIVKQLVKHRVADMIHG